jgi:hypothetical protein
MCSASVNLFGRRESPALVMTDGDECRSRRIGVKAGIVPALIFQTH